MSSIQALLVCGLLAGQAVAQETAQAVVQEMVQEMVEWPIFGNDLANTKYSPLDQINRENFGDLEIAWQWESISLEVSRANPRVKPVPLKSSPQRGQ